MSVFMKHPVHSTNLFVFSNSRQGKDFEMLVTTQMKTPVLNSSYSYAFIKIHWEIYFLRNFLYENV